MSSDFAQITAHAQLLREVDRLIEQARIVESRRDELFLLVHPESDQGCSSDRQQRPLKKLVQGKSH